VSYAIYFVKEAIQYFLDSVGQNILGHALYRGPKKYFTIRTSCVSKDAEFCVDFKNINLP
jgi:hypothetical protein